MLSIEVLQKYSKVSTSDNFVIFNSTDFNHGQDIYLEIETKSNAEKNYIMIIIMIWL